MTTTIRSYTGFSVKLSDFNRRLLTFFTLSALRIYVEEVRTKAQKRISRLYDDQLMSSPCMRAFQRGVDTGDTHTFRNQQPSCQFNPAHKLQMLFYGNTCQLTWPEL